MEYSIIITHKQTHVNTCHIVDIHHHIVHLSYHALTSHHTRHIVHTRPIMYLPIRAWEAAGPWLFASNCSVSDFCDFSSCTDSWKLVNNMESVKRHGGRETITDWSVTYSFLSLNFVPQEWHLGSFIFLRREQKINAEEDLYTQLSTQGKYILGSMYLNTALPQHTDWACLVLWLWRWWSQLFKKIIIITTSVVVTLKMICQGDKKLKNKFKIYLQ